jgi:hypothetical protein
LLRRALGKKMNDGSDFLDGVVHCSRGSDPERDKT